MDANVAEMLRRLKELEELVREMQSSSASDSQKIVLPFPRSQEEILAVVVQLKQQIDRLEADSAKEVGLIEMQIKGVQGMCTHPNATEKEFHYPWAIEFYCPDCQLGTITLHDHTKTRRGRRPGQRRKSNDTE